MIRRENIPGNSDVAKALVVPLIIGRAADNI